MMTEQLAMYRQFECFVKRILLCAGLWPVENKESSLFYRTLPILTVFLGILIFSGILKFCLENLDDIKILTKGLSPLASFALVAVKVGEIKLYPIALMFFIYRKELRELNLHLEEMFEEVLSKAHYRPVVLSLLNLFKRPAYMVYYLTMFIILLYICKPFILIVYQITKNINPKHYALPYPAIFPWIDGTPNIIYQIQFILEIIFGWFVVFVTSSVDTIYGFYIFQIIGILRAMSFECEKLGKSSEELNVILRNCIKRHILLLRCRDIIQNVYGPVVLGLVVSSVIVLCAIIFQMFQTEISFGKTVLFLIYGMMKLTQAFIYSWYGSILAIESETFRRSVYCCEWYQDGNIKLMKGVFLVLTQRPIVLKASKRVENIALRDRMIYRIKYRLLEVIFCHDIRGIDLTCLWPVTKTESSYFYRHLPILTIFSGTFMCYGGITFCIENLDNIKVFTKGLSPLGGFALVVVKFIEKTEISIEKVVMVVLYGLLKMTQAFIYSWYGNILAVESEAFRRNVYCCGWYEDGNIELMKDVLFILAQKPIVLTACHFFHISLDLFVKILNTSLSYYFLLQTIDEAYN
ncbi:odorant receptor 22c-like [Polistes fuscatus]|uniref:odorant receptor 22c-like n=1 Tax=Polistes fuscatus TaxID=30207 RepID=UPI001CA9BC7A|nr:odorant receptor 22c-like [Polistes fuscatus]